MKGLKQYREAQEILDKLYDGTIPLKKEVKVSLYYEYINSIRKSAYLGFADAQFELALHYEEINYFGINPKYNKMKCKYWYNKACNGGVAESCNNLAIIYESENEIELSAKFYEKAIKLGSVNAIENYVK